MTHPSESSKQPEDLQTPETDPGLTEELLEDAAEETVAEDPVDDVAEELSEDSEDDPADESDMDEVAEEESVSETVENDESDEDAAEVAEDNLNATTAMPVINARIDDEPVEEAIEADAVVEEVIVEDVVTEEEPAEATEELAAEEIAAEDIAEDLDENAEDVAEQETEEAEETGPMPAFLATENLDSATKIGPALATHTPTTQVPPADPFEMAPEDQDPPAPLNPKEKIRAQRRALARAAAREDAVEGPKAFSRILQVLLAIFAPIAVLALVVRGVASHAFLWLEYHRPGFPIDEFGWGTEERTRYASYGLDYLFNFASSGYLGKLNQDDGSALFRTEEVQHMADVKAVMGWGMLLGVIAIVISVIAIIILFRTRKGAIGRSLFAGSVWFTVALIGLGVLAVIGWDSFFAGFHQLFFSEGTWMFYTTDSLIRLYPGPFWIDAAATIGVVMFLILITTLVVTFPTKRRRENALQAQVLLISQKTNVWDDVPTAAADVVEPVTEEPGVEIRRFD